MRRDKLFRLVTKGPCKYVWLGGFSRFDHKSDFFYLKKAAF